MKLTQEDREEILANARIVNWEFRPALVKGPDGWKLRDDGIGPLIQQEWKRERLDRKRRSAGLGRHPIWTGEPRPDGYDVLDVETTLPSGVLNDAELRKFCSLAYSRASQVIGAREFYQNTHIDEDFEPPVKRGPRSESVLFPDDVVSDALRKLPAIKRMVKTGREAQVETFVWILTQGVSLAEGVERLSEVGLQTSVVALKKKLQRWREQLKRTRFSPANVVIMRIAKRSPEGTKVFLLGLARALGLTYDELNRVCKSGSDELRRLEFQRYQFKWSYTDKSYQNPIIDYEEELDHAYDRS